MNVIRRIKAYLPLCGARNANQFVQSFSYLLEKLPLLHFHHFLTHKFPEKIDLRSHFPRDTAAPFANPIRSSTDLHFFRAPRMLIEVARMIEKLSLVRSQPRTWPWGLSHLSARFSTKTFKKAASYGARTPSTVQTKGVNKACRRSHASRYLRFFSASALKRTAFTV